MHFKQNNGGEWSNDIKVKNSNSEYLGQVEYKIIGIFLNLYETSSMDNATKGRIWQYEYWYHTFCESTNFLWNKVGLKQVMQTMK